MHIDFWLDPACPWCWVTSRWLIEVQPHRDLHITWRPISLWRLNREAETADHLQTRFAAHRMLRVCEAVREREDNEAVGRFYTVLGTSIHHDRVRWPELAEALRAAALDPTLAEAADDDRWDALIEADMNEGLELAGGDVGTPLVGFGGRAAYFGPVVSPAPTGQEALALFDALATLATQDGFFELKRTRQAKVQFGTRPEVPTVNAAAEDEG